jgi:hypothetical protein
MRTVRRNCVLRTTTMPQRHQTKGTKMPDTGISGLWGLMILVGDVVAIVNIFQSPCSNEKKLIWIIAVVLLPLLGLILWYFLGPREVRA